MKRFAIILTVLISCLSFAAFQNNVKFTEQPFQLSLDDYIIKTNGNINVENAVKNFSSPVSNVSKVYDSGKWINSEQLRLEELEEKVEKQTSWIDFPANTNSKIEYVTTDKKDLEFIFKSNDTYYDRDMDGEPLPGAMLSIALGCSVIAVLGKAKKKN